MTRIGPVLEIGIEEMEHACRLISELKNEGDKTLIFSLISDKYYLFGYALGMQEALMFNKKEEEKV